ncbi:type II toxin-antitoxin system Phd/YefM family antitoxin [Ramlibacter tataouinensis]|uniref:Antitoxin n=1 Tax=Ramlibacter tataouinensis (strain ATCC BAA-407 / DSM 14655 / LMG 21543 / TTB310) TaxID=365046 RepID=F5Y1A0_RAMTT|nr:type II toxin-antitoxin system Phd/YefM family antitoxin [Ramlibacter tataouinensis]AEG93501.1 Conserved hypothetical protein [Ramlibacter tataouinensis TTB310]
MAATWQVHDAKNRLSELMDRAVKEGPQVITRHGRPVVKVVAVDAHEATQPAGDDGFFEFLMSAPKIDELELPVRRGRKAPPELG